MTFLPFIIPRLDQDSSTANEIADCRPGRLVVMMGELFAQHPDAPLPPLHGPPSSARIVLPELVTDVRPSWAAPERSAAGVALAPGAVVGAAAAPLRTPAAATANDI